MHDAHPISLSTLRFSVNKKVHRNSASQPNHGAKLRFIFLISNYLSALSATTQYYAITFPFFQKLRNSLRNLLPHKHKKSLPSLTGISHCVLLCLLLLVCVLKLSQLHIVHTIAVVQFVIQICCFYTFQQHIVRKIFAQLQ